ncbi:J domain-containing protein [Kitasatospora sp. NPDC004669]|uniref:J domain-containing protein n=1 Tax=Kitasatospora sp. NPDC004669 TaxID=3154555 RepID=UPI0033A10AEB
MSADLIPYARSLAYADTSDEGGPGREWMFGVPYGCDHGYCVPWCMHCCGAMVDPCSPGATAPYLDLHDGEPEPPCADGHQHTPVYICTPFDDWHETPCIDLDLANRDAARRGEPPIGPFDFDRLYDVDLTWQHLPARVSGTVGPTEQEAQRYREINGTISARRPLSGQAAHRLLHELAGRPQEQLPVYELYRAASLRWHPDRDGGDAEVFQLLAAAYRTARLFPQQPTPASAPSAPPHAASAGARRSR